jgi:hypothetical protein
MCYPSIKSEKRKLGKIMQFDKFKRIIDELYDEPINEEVINNRKKLLKKILTLDEDINSCELDSVRKGKISLKLFGIGEPLLNPDFIKMIKYLKDKDFYVSFNTNASLLSNEITKELLETDTIDRINLSIDSVEKKQFENIRVGLNFDEVMNNLDGLLEQINKRKLLNKKVPKIYIICVILKENKKNLAIIKSFFNKKGIEVDFRPDVRINKGKPKNFSCSKISHSCFITTELEVYKCIFDYMGNTYMGNLAKETLKDIWLGQNNMRIIMMNMNGVIYETPVCKRACVTL